MRYPSLKSVLLQTFLMVVSIGVIIGILEAIAPSGFPLFVALFFYAAGSLTGSRLTTSETRRMNGD